MPTRASIAAIYFSFANDKVKTGCWWLYHVSSSPFLDIVVHVVSGYKLVNTPSPPDDMVKLWFGGSIVAWQGGTRRGYIQSGFDTAFYWMGNFCLGNLTTSLWVQHRVLRFRTLMRLMIARTVSLCITFFNGLGKFSNSHNSYRQQMHCAFRIHGQRKEVEVHWFDISEYLGYNEQPCIKKKIRYASLAPFIEPQWEKQNLTCLHLLSRYLYF